MDLKNKPGSIYRGTPKKGQKPGCTLTVSDEHFVDLTTGKMSGQQVHITLHQQQDPSPCTPTYLSTSKSGINFRDLSVLAGKVHVYVSLFFLRLCSHLFLAIGHPFTKQPCTVASILCCFIQEIKFNHSFQTLLPGFNSNLHIASLPFLSICAGLLPGQDEGCWQHHAEPEAAEPFHCSVKAVINTYNV